LLDVGCGTGSHLERFREVFDHVEGVEPALAMRRLAEKKLPSLPIHAADMRGFRLDHKFDAVSCMFGPIGYMADETQLYAALRCMAAHLVVGGVLVLDPWWFPENFIDGYVMAEVARDEGRSVARVSHSVRTGSSMCITAKYLVGDTAGITEFCTQDTLRLFREDQYADAFTKAELTVEYLPSAATDRGLFVGTRSGDPSPPDRLPASGRREALAPPRRPPSGSTPWPTAGCVSTECRSSGWRDGTRTRAPESCDIAPAASSRWSGSRASTGAAGPGDASPSSTSSTSGYSACWPGRGRRPGTARTGQGRAGQHQRRPARAHRPGDLQQLRARARWPCGALCRALPRSAGGAARRLSQVRARRLVRPQEQPQHRGHGRGPDRTSGSGLPLALPDPSRTGCSRSTTWPTWIPGACCVPSLRLHRATRRTRRVRRPARCAGPVLPQHAVGVGHVG
jgi:dTDP-3-amino-3,4,6-trideoxy-alpha-D-glucopyranose N,N-dimethyltransferase